MNTLIPSDDHTVDVSAPSEHVTVGEELRAAREGRGLSREDICREIRVVRDYLVAVEEGNFDRLPSKAYARGIIRSYAGCVGLSADDLIALYDGSCKPAAKKIDAHDDATPGDRQRQVRWEKGWWIVPLMLFAIVLVSTFLFSDPAPEGERSREVAVATPSPAAPVPVQSPISSAHGGVVSASEPAPLPAANSELPDDHASPGVYLKLKVDRDSGLTITIDGALTQRYDLKAGDLIEWKGERLFTLDMGNAGGIEGEFNGKPLKPFGEPGKTAHIELQADGS